MPDTNHPPSPSQIPGHSRSNGGVLAVVALLLVGAIGGVVYKVTQHTEVPVAAPPKPSATATATQAALIDPPPPPPPVEEDAGSDAGPRVATGGGGSPCSGGCSGSATGALQSAVGSRTGAARGCYERALRQSSTLEGRLVARVRVDQGGNVCAASIGDDSLHSGEVSSCVLNLFRGQKFPPPSGGCVDINVPFNFHPKEAK